jgi:hypothetical protein
MVLALPPPICTIQVMDNQSATCDIAINKVCDNPPKELVGYYKANNNTLDSSLKGNNGSWDTSPPLYVSGVEGPSFWFQGPPQIGDPPATIDLLEHEDVIIPDTGANSDFDVPNRFTLSAWVYRPFQAFNTGLKIIIKPFDMANNPPWELYSLDYKNNAPCSNLAVGCPCVNISNGLAGAGGWINACSPQATPFEQWHHITGTFDGTNLSIYVDGSLKQTNNVSATVPSITPNDMSVYIGGVSGGWFHFNGFIDETKIYNYSLDAGEVCWLCNEAKPWMGATCNC